MGTSPVPISPIFCGATHISTNFFCVAIYALVFKAKLFFMMGYRWCFLPCDKKSEHLKTCPPRQTEEWRAYRRAFQAAVEIAVHPKMRFPVMGFKFTPSRLKQIKKELWGDPKTNSHLPLMWEWNTASWPPLVCWKWNCFLSRQAALNIEKGLLTSTQDGVPLANSTQLVCHLKKNLSAHKRTYSLELDVSYLAEAVAPGPSPFWLQASIQDVLPQVEACQRNIHSDRLEETLLYAEPWYERHP